MADLIEGFISSIVFSNAENGYTVLRLDTTEGTVTAAGSFPGISPGEHLRVSGSFGVHPQYGEQFKAESFEVIPPSDVQEVFRYLASGAVKHIGPGRARDIVDRFGTEALLILDSNPDRLSEVRGISLRTARKIGSEYQKQIGLRRLAMFLGRYNIKPLVASRVYKDYGDDALEAVKANPYIISSDSRGGSFSDADAIAIDLGFESDCPERISAALIYTLSHNLSNGHTFIPEEKLTAAVSDLIGVETGSVSDALDALCEFGDVIRDNISDIKACYLSHLYDAESYVAMRLRNVAGVNDSRRITYNAAAIADEPGFCYSSMQSDALKLASEHRVLVLTGGPGTGKTTTVRGILRLFQSAGLDTCLCAPTGRAAKRLSELCGSEAATIHRLLGASRSDDGAHLFEHDELNPLDADAVIADECSMIDILLMNALLRALKPSCRIILVGDVDQLPSIGPGNVFADIIRSGTVPVVALSEIFRQASDSGIVRCAHSVNKGFMPDLTEKYHDLFFMRRQNGEQLAETVAGLYCERLPANMGIDPMQIQVLSPTRKGSAGTFALNNLLRERQNPRSADKREKQSGDFLFRTGDKVMQIKNNYDILWQTGVSGQTGAGVFNGDTGIIRDIDHNRETVTVDFEDKLVTYAFDQLTELEPAFAVTVHKSQGSEYQAVILAMTSAAPLLLTRSVLYTAMTRAKSLLVIVGSADVMNKMVLNDKRQKRYSGLRARLAFIEN